MPPVTFLWWHKGDICFHPGRILPLSGTRICTWAVQHRGTSAPLGHGPWSKKKACHPDRGVVNTTDRLGVCTVHWHVCEGPHSAGCTSSKLRAVASLRHSLSNCQAAWPLLRAYTIFWDKAFKLGWVLIFQIPPRQLGLHQKSPGQTRISDSCSDCCLKGNCPRME